MRRITRNERIRDIKPERERGPVVFKLPPRGDAEHDPMFPRSTVAGVWGCSAIGGLDPLPASPTPATPEPVQELQQYYEQLPAAAARNVADALREQRDRPTPMIADVRMWRLDRHGGETQWLTRTTSRSRTTSGIDDEEYNPQLEPKSAKAWLNLLQESEDAFEDWNDHCDNIDKQYANLERLSQMHRDKEFQMFWANCEVIKPSIYAKPPMPVVVPKFKDGGRSTRPRARCWSAALSSRSTWRTSTS